MLIHFSARKPANVPEIVFTSWMIKYLQIMIKIERFCCIRNTAKYISFKANRLPFSVLQNLDDRVQRNKKGETN
jgi:hypothetical protein